MSRVRLRIGFLLAVLAAGCGAFPVFLFAAPAGQVLEIPLDARTSAMGNAAVALRGDVASQWYNPAGIYDLTFPSVQASYRKDLDDIRFGGLNAAWPLAPGVLGLGLQALYGGVLNLSDGRQVMAEEDYTLLAGYALDLAGIFQWGFPLAAGINAKYLYSTLASEFTAQAMAVDLGVQAGLPMPGLALGAAVRNFGTGLQYAQEVDSLPITLDVGVSWSGPLSTILDLVALADVWIPSERPTLVHLGLELGVLKMFFLRGGYRLLHDTDSFTAGFGLFSHQFRFDYAFVQNQFAPKHLVTIGYQWGQPEAAQDDSLSAAARGIALYKQGRLHEAKQAWSETLAKNPDNPSAKAYLANFAAAQKHWGLALHTRAVALAEKNDFAGAAAQWREILAVNPEDPNAQAGLAGLATRANRHLQAAKVFQGKAQWSQALAEVEQALQIVPELPSAFRLRAGILSLLYKQKLQMQRLMVSTIQEAGRLASDGKPAEAMDLLQTALAANPGDSSLLAAQNAVPERAHRKALAFKQARQYQSALALWTQIMEIAPDFAPAKVAYQKTVQFYRETILVLDTRAAEAYQRIDYAQAIKLGEERYGQAPEPEAARQLVRAYLAQGILDYRQDRLRDAIANWERAQALDLSHPNLVRNLRRARNKLRFLRELGLED